MFTASKVLWFFATPSNLLPSLVLLGIALQSVKRVRWWGAALASAAALLVLAAGLSPLANWVIVPLEERFPPTPVADGTIAGAIVLGGSVQAEDSFARDQLLINEAGERVLAMADLARRYPEARIVFAGGSGAILEGNIAEAAAIARFADTLGISPERILFEERSRTTRENAFYTRELVRPEAGERWLLVTSAWHMPRAVGVFRKAGFEVTPYPVDYRTMGDVARWRPFATASDGLRRLDLAAREWVGLIAYRIAGYTDQLFPGPSDGSESR
ncbi:YdcF family protein [Microvirga massiliensis]|uniref:YdcF family protein n=1 Tax=Microvirga massiliensis TaxID=1033741 RepID=UPI00062B4714|nr:YdcF family protein [Microvirga massiliensis]